MSKLIGAMGGNELTAYGLCHLGDYQATVFSRHSHNRAFGEAFVKREPYTELAEGYYTARAVEALAEECGVETPINHVVYDILYNGKDPKQVLRALFLRSVKPEF